MQQFADIGFVSEMKDAGVFFSGRTAGFSWKKAKV